MVTAVFTVIISPHSSTIVIYLCFLFILFVSTLLAYGITKLVGISLFFVGAGNWFDDFSFGLHPRNAGKLNFFFHLFHLLGLVAGNLYRHICFALRSASILVSRLRDNSLELIDRSLPDRAPNQLDIRGIPKWVPPLLENGGRGTQWNPMDLLSLPSPHRRVGHCGGHVPALVIVLLWRKLRRENPDSQLEINFIQQNIE